jgi:hypothetical protein
VEPFASREEIHMTGPKKRSHPRYSPKVLVRFRCFELACGDLELSTEALNISHHGLFMPSKVRLRIGSLLSLALRVPTEISGSAFNELRCAGRVVHEQDLGGGRFAYGVEIEGATTPLQRMPRNGGYAPSIRI